MLFKKKIPIYTYLKTYFGKMDEKQVVDFGNKIFQ